MAEARRALWGKLPQDMLNEGSLYNKIREAALAFDTADATVSGMTQLH